MAKNSKKLTPLQIEAKTEYEKMLRRFKSWEKTHKVVVTDIPEFPKRVTKQFVESLKSKTWKNLSKEDKEKYQKEYEYRYENSEPVDFLNDYKVPSEKDYYNNTPIDTFEFDETQNEPLNSADEYTAWLSELIDTVLDTSSIHKPNYEIKETLQRLIESARNSMGDDKQFFNFLIDNDRVTRLQQVAYEGMSTSPRKNGYMGYTINDAVVKFATELNAGNPLSDEDAYSIQAYGVMDFDYENLED